jgi:predicted nucleic acid-binding protein
LILLDTSGLFVALNPDEPAAGQMLAVLEEDRGPYILSPFVLAELGYLVASRARSPQVELALLGEVARGTYDLTPFAADDIALAAAVIDKYRDLRVGLADASIVVLAERYETNRVLTLDERHFRALRVGRRRFVVLPADA